jgi:predicted RND superfamily exporter protein
MDAQSRSRGARLAAFPFEHPLAVVLAALALTAAAAVFAVRVEIDPSIEGMIQDDPEERYYRGFLARYGSDELAIVGLRSRELFAAGRLEQIRRVSERMLDIALPPGGSSDRPQYLIDDVLSLSSVPYIDSELDGDGERAIVIRDLVSALPRTAEERRALLERALADPTARGLLSTPQGTHPDDPLSTLILGRVAYRPGDRRFRGELERQLESLVHEEWGADASGVDVRIAGSSIVRAVIARLIAVEAVRSEALAWAISTLLLLLAFRSLRLAMLPLVAVAAAGTWTLAILVLCGSSINVLSVVILPLVHLTAVATGVHLFAAALRPDSVALPPRARVERALRRVAWPAFLMSATTAEGFASLGVSPLVPVREAGIYSAIGVLATWVLMVSLVPVLLVGAVRRGAAPPPASERIEAALDRLAVFATRRRGAVIAVGALVLGLSALGATRIRTETDLLEYFRPAHPLRATYDALARDFGGLQTFEVVVRTAPGHALDPEVLGATRRLQDWLELQPDVSATLSVVDHLERLQQQWTGSAEASLPESAAQAASLVFLFESGAGTSHTRRLLHPGWERPEELRISGRTPLFNSHAIERLVARIDRFARDELGARGEPPGDGARPALAPGEIAVRVTGVTALYARMAEQLVTGQIQSLAVAVLAIWAALLLAMRSFAAATIAMVPNVLPIALLLGAMGGLGVTLNVGTAMVSSICLGIAVDDTIHLMTGYRRHLEAGLDVPDAIRASLREVGRPILITTAVLSVGFLSFAAAEFRPVFDLGVLSSVTIALAAVGDLVLLPALLATLRPLAPGRARRR